MKKVKEVIKKLAQSQAPIFIHGESGTGKELVAKSIHMQSARKDAPFIAVNCGTIPENLVKSEFFGYKKGAFTGVNKDTKGLFSSANSGTIFLDEVANLPLAMQVKLLMATQERAVKPIGASQESPIDVRIISATHKNLSKLVEDGVFRKDLYYRLNVISLGLPSLRKRTGDIIVLARFIIKKISKRQGTKSYLLTSEAENKLNKYDFPGNVRELENILERATTFCSDNKIIASDIRFSTQVADYEEPDNIANFYFSDGIDEDNENIYAFSEKQEDQQQISSEEIRGLPSYLEDIERKAIESALLAANNNKTKVAEKFGMSFRALRYKLQKYNIN